MRRLALATLVVLEAVAILGVTAPALAHAPERGAAGALAPMVDVSVESAAPAVPALVDPIVTMIPASPAEIWLPLLILIAFLFVTSRSRRVVAGALIGLLAVLAFEAGLHSVHHLGQQRDATRCIIESVSSNLGGAVGEPMILVGPAETADLALHLESVAPPQRSLRPDRGRAPPFLA
jgi:hypothetical protein